MNGFRVRIPVALRAVIVSLAALLILPPPLATAESPPDPSKHPVYSTYAFDRGGKTVRFGTIPLGAEGVIAEAMKHDRLLRSGLKAIGFDIAFYPFHKGADVAFFAKRGDIDLGTVGAGPAMTVAATADIRITGMTKVSSASLVARKGVRSVRDLKGLKIGFPEGGNAQLGLFTALSMAGLKDTDVKLFPMDVGEVSDALADGRIDAFSAFEPTPTGALAKHREFVQVHRFFLPGYLITDRAFADRNREAVVLLHASLARSVRWLRKDAANVATAAGWALKSFEGLAGRKSEVTVAQLVQVTTDEVLRFADIPAVGKADFRPDNFLHKSFLLLQAQGKVPSDVPWERIRRSVDTRVLKDVLSSRRKYGVEAYAPE